MVEAPIVSSSSDVISSGGVTTTLSELDSLLSEPSTSSIQSLTISTIQSSLKKDGNVLTVKSLTNTLPTLLNQYKGEELGLEQELERSTASIEKLLKECRNDLKDLLGRTVELKNNHENLEEALFDHREVLISRPSAGNAGQISIRDRLKEFEQKRLSLKTALQYFSVLEKAEELGLTSLRALKDESLPGALSGYVQLVEYIKSIHQRAPALNLTNHLVAMASSVWNQLVKALSARLLQRLEALGWPTPIKEPLDDYDQATADFRASFTDLLILENIQTNHPLPSASSNALASLGPAKPLLALTPLVHPLLLRFRWHFDGDRNTNRIDKPEYPLSHVLNLLSAHDQFLSTEIQTLLDENGFEHVDAIVDFTTLLLPPLAARINHHMPQLLEMPPILAHTIFQILEFDAVLKSRNYCPRGQSMEEWKGLSELILGRKEWFDEWLSCEKRFFETKYFEIISDPEAWQLILEDEFESSDGSTRPTVSALKVSELVQLISDRYRPLPVVHALPFLFTLHLPLISSYVERVTSSLDAFETLGFNILPGALGTTTAATSGLGGLQRLVRAGISARFLEEKCLEWGEDAYFLSLYDHVKNKGVDYSLELIAKEVIDHSDGTLFDRERKSFEKLVERSEEVVVRQVVREIMAELKAYLGKRWDFNTPSSIDESGQIDLSLTQELITPLSLLTSMLTFLVQSYSPSLSTTLYRRISVTLSTMLYERLLVNRAWSEPGAEQLVYDIENGFFQAAREAGIKRGVNKGWELFMGGARIMALPAGTGNRSSFEGKEGAEENYSFSKVMQIAFDDAEPEGEGTRFASMMDQLGVGEALGKVEVRQVMRRRPECWR